MIETDSNPAPDSTDHGSCAVAPCSAPSVLWNAVAQVIADEGKPLEVWRVAEATGQTEEQIISALIRESSRNGAVTFRYPPLPCAAIIRIELPNTSEQVGR